MVEVLERLRHALTAGVRGLSAEETQARPASGGWSIQQVVEHLLLSYGATSAVAEARLAKGVGTKATPTLGQRVGQIAVTRLGLFPKGRKAPAAVTPTDEPVRRLSGEELEVQVGEMLARMDGLLTQAEAMFGGTRAMSHLVLGPMTVRGWRHFHLVHGKHHLQQIEAMRAGRERLGVE